MSTPSATLTWSFAILALLLGAAFPTGLFWAMRRLGSPPGAALRTAVLGAVGTAAWMAVTLAAAARGLLAFGPVPPPFALLFLVTVAGTATVGFSRVGKRLATGLPLAALVGVQGFRLPLELAMHRAYVEGVMPVQMSFSGLNFDILTGLGAILVAALLPMDRMPLRGVWIWNCVGSVLLLNVVTIAWLSAPTPLRIFVNEPANVWITQPPFVWLPAVMVAFALLGHILVFRRLRADAARKAGRADSFEGPDEPGAPQSHLARGAGKR